MKIGSVALTGVRGLADRYVDWVSSATGRPHDLVVVAGPPASGKTRFLEALIAAFETVGGYMGIVRGSDWAASRAAARVELGLHLDPDERQAAPGAGHPARAVALWSQDGIAAEVDRGLSRVLERYSHDGAGGKREYFPENRKLAWGSRVDGLSALEQSILRPSKDPQKYSFVPRFLERLSEDPEGQQAFAGMLESLSPSVRYLPKGAPDARSAWFSSRGGDGSFLSELSSSEADAVLIASTVSLLGLNHSIVFLDRPELYVPSERLVPWVRALTTIGHDNQWIVATGSRRLVEAVETSQLVLLRPLTGGASVEVQS
ncbi:MAG: ATP-binding protein [Polyangiaceae bacterium]|nr:ATP-binding protein [Polyangiaceae bacterium]